MTFLAELRRRNVFRIVGLYLVGAWLLVQVAGTLLPMFDAPSWVARAIVITLAVAFLPVLAFSWAFEITPDGLKREAEVDRGAASATFARQRLQRGLVVVVLLALGFLVVDKFVLAPGRESAKVDAALLASRATTPALRGEASIAVLPFVNMSSDKEQEYFSDGISEELLNQLAQIPELRVIARTSSFAFKGKDTTVASIGEQLKVAHVLEGSVRKSGDTLRITAQLIRTADSSHLWSDTYDRKIDDVFAVQDEISAAVVEQLKIKLLGAPPKARKSDSEAFALILRARPEWRRGTAESIKRAIDLLERAVAIDPGASEAWSELSLAYLVLGNSGPEFMDPQIWDAALGAARKALLANPHNASAHARLANLAERDNDLASAATHLERAVASGKPNSDVADELGNLNVLLGRFDRAIAFHRYAGELDPMSPYAHGHLSHDYIALGRFDEGIASARLALALSPDSEWWRLNLVNGLLLKGEAQAALDESASWKGSAGRRFAAAVAYPLVGRAAEGERVLADLVAHEGKWLPYAVAVAFAQRGDADGAFKWLERTESADPASLVGLHADPNLRMLHDDPRWPVLMKRLGQTREQMDAVAFDVALPGS